MVGTLNKVILIGNVGKDPEIRLTQDGKEIVSFPLATSETWKDKNTGEKKEKTEWHKVVVFVPQIVDIVKRYVKKGNKIYIEGSLQTRRWLDQSNTEKYITEVLLQSYNSILMLLENKGGYGGSEQEASHSTENSGKGQNNNSSRFLVEEMDDEIPF